MGKIVGEGSDRMFYDTHAHLNAEQFKENLEEVVKEAKEAGVEHINVIGFDRETNLLAQEIAAKNDNLYPTAGLHPTDVNEFTEQDLVVLEEYIKKDVTVGIGECGLDYYWHNDNKDRQKYFFIAQIELARKYHKPLVIHVRDAFQDTYDLLASEMKKGFFTGVMHCFSGSPEMAKRFLDLGLYISLGGPVTFKNAVTPKEVARVVPLDKLLIETDCPYLAPHPYRGKQNKPSYLPLIAKAIAEIKEVSIEEVANYTTLNAKRLFLK